jgi:hypothetical protein
VSECRRKAYDRTGSIEEAEVSEDHFRSLYEFFKSQVEEVRPAPTMKWTCTQHLSHIRWRYWRVARIHVDMGCTWMDEQVI